MTVTATQVPFSVEAGSPHPLGAVPGPAGVNFSLFSSNATGVELLLFSAHDSPQPFQVIQFDPYVNRTFHFWHVFVRGLKPGAHYAYRVDGPCNPAAGHRFNRNKVLIDPYARGNTNTFWDRGSACGPDDNVATSMRSVVIDASGYDWEGDQPLDRPMEEPSSTRCTSAASRNPLPRASRIPGRSRASSRRSPTSRISASPRWSCCRSSISTRPMSSGWSTGNPCRNYWGYSTMGFFAPQSAYCVEPESGSHLREFRDMVKALHRAGIEVILDVVFNHTDEGNHQGPTFCFRGIDNRTYYFLVPWDLQYYMDFSGCGNTLNCNHPIAQKLILDCLRYWVREMHVDGFRFDVGSILSRGEDGDAAAPIRRCSGTSSWTRTWPMRRSSPRRGTPPACTRSGISPATAGRNGTAASATTSAASSRAIPGWWAIVASRLAGSADLYQATGELPLNSINFVTCHDGFTLNDLVSYNEKHNEANGEGQQRRHQRQPQLELRRGGRRTTPRSRRSATARCGTSRPSSCSRAASRCLWPATRSAAPSAATTTPTARTTRSAGSTGTS